MGASRSVKLRTASNGSVTLSPEDTASDVVLSVPAVAGEVVNDVTLRTELNATGSAPIYACRAWVNFDGTGTPSIRASGNVSSITDNGTGIYAVNFATAMEDANYATTASVSQRGGVTLDTSIVTSGTNTTNLSVLTLSQGALFDAGEIAVVVFR